MEQVLFSLPLAKLEPLIKGWVKEALSEIQLSKSEQNEPEQIFNVPEAANFLGLTVPTIYSKTSKGELPVMKRGKRLYFSSSELLEYLKEGRKKTNAEIEEEANNHLLKNQH